MLSVTVGYDSELAFAAEATRRGFVVSHPFGDPRYDMVTDFNGIMYRIQVKSTDYERRGEFSFNLSTGGKNRRSYGPKDVDFIACHVKPRGVWYIIPISEVSGNTKVSVRPDADNISRYNQFEGAWHLMQE